MGYLSHSYLKLPSIPSIYSLYIPMIPLYFPLTRRSEAHLDRLRQAKSKVRRSRRSDNCLEENCWI